MSLYESLAVTSAQNGKVFASGTLTPVDEDVDVISGLSVVDHCGVSLAGAPTITHSISIARPSATLGNVRIQSYRPTSAANPTPIVSTVEGSVTWWAIGDR